MRQRSESEIPLSRPILGGAAGRRLGTVLCLVGLSPPLAGGRGKPAGGRSGGAAAASRREEMAFPLSTPVLKFLAFPFPLFPRFFFSKSKLKLNLQRNYLFQSWSRGVY